MIRTREMISMSLSTYTIKDDLGVNVVCTKCICESFKNSYKDLYICNACDEEHQFSNVVDKAKEQARDSAKL